MEIGIGLHAGEAPAEVERVCAGLAARTAEVGYRLVAGEPVLRQLTMSLDAVRLGPLELDGHAPVEAYGIDPLVDEDALPEATRLVLERNRRNRGSGRT
jgi:hypothetical protein